MKKEQSPNRTTLFSKSKDTKKSFRYRKSDAVKHLEMLANESARKRYPNVPYLAPRDYRDKTTNELVKCVGDFLKLKNHLCERTGNAGRIVDNRSHVTDVLGKSRLIGSIQRLYSSEAKSPCQLKAEIGGKSVSIEIKSVITHDNQDQPQRTYRVEVEKSGGIYLFITDFESFLTWYKNFAL